MRIQTVLITLVTLCFVGLGQERRPGQKPVLIRADEEFEEEEIIVHDPVKAKEHVEIGDFYFRKDNYKAAEERYREAIKYNTKWAEPYEKLVESLEKLGQLQSAVQVCELYLENNPDSSKAQDFRKRAKKLSDLNAPE